MPWCEHCDRFLNPNSVDADGGCPGCGAEVEAARETAAAADERIPWHFWVGVAALGLYLGWRAIQAVLLVF